MISDEKLRIQRQYWGAEPPDKPKDPLSGRIVHYLASTRPLGKFVVIACRPAPITRDDVTSNPVAVTCPKCRAKL